MKKETKGQELTDAELEQAVGGMGLQEGSVGSVTVPDTTVSVSASAAEQTEMLQVQMAMQRENTMFSSISNVLKTKHDTTKNSISNIR